MTYFSEYYQWYFPGGVAGVSLAFVFLAALIFVSYRYSMKDAATSRKILLVLLRSFFAAGLLFCLCNPSRVKEKIEVSGEKPAVAFIVDESGSMREKGYNGRSRIDEAERFFRRVAASSESKYDFKLFAFARELRRVKDFEELKRGGEERLDTALFRNISEWTSSLAAENVKAVICVTDGVDTVEGNREEALAALSASGIPQMFFPALMKLPFQPSLEMIHLECPSDVRPGAMFPVRALLRKSGRLSGGKILFTVKKNEEEVYREEIDAKGQGDAHYPVKFNTFVPDESTHVFEFELKAGGIHSVKAVCSVSASKSIEQKILLYQGRLTFDQAYLRRVFFEDKRAELNICFAKDVLGARNPENSRIGTGFPDYDTLSKYNIVIINAIKKSQISKQMEKDLKKYLDNGGALLFMVVNNAAASEYAGSELEKLLPAVFGNLDRDGHDAATMGFIQKMRDYRKGIVRRNMRGEVIFPPLNKFEITEDGEKSRIFTVSRAEGVAQIIIPQFQDFAIVKDIKPGGVLLARNADFKKGDTGYPMLAVQNYGRGRSAVLCTDGMWQWKLSIPSSENSYEVFWQNLLLWLSAGSVGKPVWELSSLIFPSNKSAVLNFKFPRSSEFSFSDLKFEAENLLTGKSQLLEMKPAPGNALSGEISGATGTSYKLKVFKGLETVSEAIINFRKSEAKSEMDKLAPDVKTLLELAKASGTELLSAEKIIDWDKIISPAEKRKISSQKDYLWHGKWVFIILLSAFLSELALRRFFRFF